MESTMAGRRGGGPSIWGEGVNISAVKGVKCVSVRGMELWLVEAGAAGLNI